MIAGRTEPSGIEGLDIQLDYNVYEMPTCTVLGAPG